MSAAPAKRVRFTLNGRARAYRGPAFKRLIDVLREDYSLTGTKEGCGEGECGACSVLVDGQPVNSCLLPVCQVDGAEIETVEALGSPKKLSPLQQAFLDHGGAQCGICTPGMLMTALAWVRSGGSDDEAAIREQLAGNLCRCTGYQHIVDAVAATVRQRGKHRAAPGKRRVAAAVRRAARRAT
jgi:carbon-monoxide dehydrogenase small subunit